MEPSMDTMPMACLRNLLEVVVGLAEHLSVQGSGSTGNSADAGVSIGIRWIGQLSGDVTVINTAETITTTGDFATAFAQSIGGSGGAGGSTLSYSLSGSTGKNVCGGRCQPWWIRRRGSTAGNVSVTSSSDISTGAVDSKGDVISGDLPMNSR